MPTIRATNIKGFDGPLMGLAADFSVEWNYQTAFILDLEGTVEFEGKLISPSIELNLSPWGGSTQSLVENGGTPYGSLRFTLHSPAISFIESSRREGDVPLNIRVKFVWQEVSKEGGKPGSPVFRLGAVHRDATQVQGCVVSRSDWLKRLEEMGWEEYEIFEIPRMRLVEDTNLKIALQRLSEAQVSLRLRDSKTVLAKCRLAYESAAKYEGKGDSKSGFYALLNRAFPEEPNRQAALNEAILGLSNYAHVAGRHEQYPALHVSHEEAVFSYASTVAFFAMLGQKLHENN